MDKEILETITQANENCKQAMKNLGIYIVPEIFISKTEQEDVQEKLFLLQALIESGVDNWSGWENAHDRYEELKAEYYRKEEDVADSYDGCEGYEGKHVG